MKPINLRRGLHRIFALMVACWCAYWLFVAPIFMARQGEKHYQKDMEDCYRDYGSYGHVADNSKVLASCLEESKHEWVTGLYSGFHFLWKEGEFWSYKGYWLGEGWFLVMVIAIPPVLLYGSAWAVALVCRWIWRGFRPSQTV